MVPQLLKILDRDAEHIHADRPLPLRMIARGDNPLATDEYDDGYVKENPTVAEYQVALGKIKSVLTLIESKHQDLANFLNRNIQFIELSTVADHDFGNFSLGDQIGVVKLKNAHLASATPLMIAEAIFHESIHSLINIVDFASPLFSNSELAIERISISRWTDAVIDTYSYVHAIFVWYGLREFNTSPFVKEHFERSEWTARASLATRGFVRAGNLLDQHCRSPNLCSPDVRLEIARLQTSVRTLAFQKFHRTHQTLAQTLNQHPQKNLTTTEPRPRV